MNGYLRRIAELEGCLVEGLTNFRIIGHVLRSSTPLPYAKECEIVALGMLVGM
jgi:hypothetical protein